MANRKKKMIKKVGVVKRIVKSSNVSVQCMFCSKMYPRMSSLETHMNLHTGEKPYQCNQCSNNYPDHRYLWCHQNNVHKGKRYECNQCDYFTSFPQNLFRHKNTHGSGKSFIRRSKPKLALKRKLSRRPPQKVGRTVKSTKPRPVDNSENLQEESKDSKKAPPETVAYGKTGAGCRPSLIPTRILNLVKGLERVTQLKRAPPTADKKDEKSEGQDKPIQEIAQEPVGNVDVKVKEKEVPPKPKQPEEALPPQQTVPLQNSSSDPQISNEAPKEDLATPKPSTSTKKPESGPATSNQVRTGEEKIDMVFLPLDDPRSVAMSKLYQPGDPHPYNLFFCANGQIVMPVLSPQLLLRLGQVQRPPPPPPSRYHSESDDDDYDNEDFSDSDSSSTPPPTTRRNRVAAKRKKTKKTFACKECGTEFQTQRKLSAHAAVHKKKNRFGCNFCKSRFVTKNALVNHLVSAHSTKQAKKGTK